MGIPSPRGGLSGDAVRTSGRVALGCRGRGKWGVDGGWNATSGALKWGVDGGSGASMGAWNATSASKKVAPTLASAGMRRAGYRSSSPAGSKTAA